MIGMAYAARHPERISRIVVMNRAAFHMPAAKSFPLALWLCRNTPLGSWLVRGLNAFARGTAYIGGAKRRMPRRLQQAYVAPYDNWQHRIAIHRFVQDIPLSPGDRAYDLVSWVESRLDLFASTPMLIAWGMNDFVFDRHFLEEWVRRFPQAEVHRYPLGGHYVLEDESEAILALVKQLLVARPAGRPREGELPHEMVF
jgi:cis-3-alkyl-4-acyloxetan-2-one decarboxylase